MPIQQQYDYNNDQYNNDLYPSSSSSSSSNLEYYKNYKIWQEELKTILNIDIDFKNNNKIRKVILILTGNSEELNLNTETWFSLFIAKLIFCFPNIKNKEEYKKIANESISNYKSLTILDKILISIIENNKTAIIRYSSFIFINFWFVCHLSHLLYFNINLIKNQIYLNNGISLKEYFILEYATSLFNNSTFWQISMDYFSVCEIYGKFYREEVCFSFLFFLFLN
jgi:hypothetical protein